MLPHLWPLALFPTALLVAYAAWRYEHPKPKRWASVFARASVFWLAVSLLTWAVLNIVR